MPKGELVTTLDMGSHASHGSDLAALESAPSSRAKPGVTQWDFSQVRANLKDYGRGLMQYLPSPYQIARQQSNQPLRILDLPPRHLTDRLLASYHKTFHVQFPIVHWPTFQSECDQLYRGNSLALLGNAWGALFLCVLACGTLHNPDSGPVQDGKAFLTTGHAMIDLWQDQFSIDHARTSLLISIFLAEINLKSASWSWLGYAIRIAQDIGLHVENGRWCPIEGEMRRRVWYCIYAWDRFDYFCSLCIGFELMLTDYWLWS
jgi:Fungal specific transcription factor domain